LGIGSIDERLRMSETTLVLLDSGLTTAAIVGALTGTSSDRQEGYAFFIVDGASYLCVGAFNTVPVSLLLEPFQRPPITKSSLTWHSAPGAEALSLIGGINATSSAHVRLRR